MDKVPSGLVRTMLAKMLGLIARLPALPAAINRLVLPPTQKNTVLLKEIEFVSGSASMLQSPPLSLVIIRAWSPTATYKPPASVTCQQHIARRVILHLPGESAIRERALHHHAVLPRQPVAAVGVPQGGVVSPSRRRTGKLPDLLRPQGRRHAQPNLGIARRQGVGALVATV